VSALAPLFLEHSEHGGTHSRIANQPFTTLGDRFKEPLLPLAGQNLPESIGAGGAPQVLIVVH
jgi:hypothetical protein